MPIRTHVPESSSDQFGMSREQYSGALEKSAEAALAYMNEINADPGHPANRSMGAIVVRRQMIPQRPSHPSELVAGVAVFGKDLEDPALQEEYGLAVQKAALRATAGTVNMLPGISDLRLTDNASVRKNLWMGCRATASITRTNSSLMDELVIGAAGGYPVDTRHAAALAAASFMEDLSDIEDLHVRPLNHAPSLEATATDPEWAARLDDPAGADAGDNTFDMTEGFANFSELPALLGFEPTYV